MKPMLACALALALAIPAIASAQSAAPAPAPAPAAEAPAPAANPNDVNSPERIVKAVYETISGPAGPRDWNRLRSLMAPGARFIVASTGVDGVTRNRFLTTEDYVSRAGPLMAKEPFFEHGVVGQVFVYGHTAQVVSPYESRHNAGDKPFARGINQYQLINDGKRWWIVSIEWEAESTPNPLPAMAEAALKGG